MVYSGVSKLTGQIGAVAEWLGLSRPPQPETLCPDNISFLESTIDMCASKCHPPTKTSFLPTRLIDVGTSPAIDPHLVITADAVALGTLNPSELVQYAALSYCWGDKADASTQTKTDPSNLPERLHAIPTIGMSAVLQDAVAVCRALKVRYLWVDALCIIQDPTDPSDWEKESELVGKVYQHAAFTICVSSSPSCHQSFLDRPQYTFTFDFESSLHPPARGTYTLYSTGLADRVNVNNSWTTDLFSSPWDRRGWVFQEQFLSARKLVFGSLMVHFECGQHQESENGELSTVSGFGEWSPARLAELDRDQLYDRFRDAVSLYASRSLSYESDRLPALTGLASRWPISQGMNIWQVCGRETFIVGCCGPLHRIRALRNTLTLSGPQLVRERPRGLGHPGGNTLSMGCLVSTSLSESATSDRNILTPMPGLY